MSFEVIVRQELRFCVSQNKVSGNEHCSPKIGCEKEDVFPNWRARADGDVLIQGHDMTLPP